MDNNKIDKESQIRLNRFIAESGLCSRRDADQVVFDGHVTVNGQVIKDPGFKLLREKDAVKVNGKRIFLQPMVYILLNKPEGVVSTADDPEKRATVISMLRGVKARVYPVGRLDINTSGVLMLTNDGDLALKLTHPRYGFEKTYQAKVSGVPSENAIYKLATGVRIPVSKNQFEKTMPAQVRLLKKIGKHALLELTLREGRQHQVKKMCQAIGHPIEKLKRVRFGFFRIGGLETGQWRYLTKEEVEKIKKYKVESVKPIRPKAIKKHPAKHPAIKNKSQKRR